MSVKMMLFALLGAIMVTMYAGSAAWAQNPFAGSNFSLDRSDIELLDTATNAILFNENPRVGESQAWANDANGNSGTVTLVKLHTYQGLPCRRLVHDIKLRRVSDPYRFIADRCKTDDGVWKRL